MSKLEVREIGPISGEADLTLGQSGGTVTLADGATAVGFGGGEGSIIQTVTARFPDYYSVAAPLQTANPGWLPFPGVELSITPKESGSIFIIIFSGNITHIAGAAGLTNIERSSPGVAGTLLDDYRDYGQTLGATASMMGWYTRGGTSIHYDEPNTTDEITYKMVASAQSSGSTVCLNYNGTNTAGTPRSVSKMIIMEVSA